MGDNNTIGLLTNINNNLDKIVKIMQPQNKNSQQAQAETVKKLNQGSGLNSASTAKDTAKKDTDNLDKISISQIISALNGLPKYVKEIANLSDKHIKNFTNVIKAIVGVFASDEFKNLDKDQTQAASNLIIALSKLDSIPDAIKSVSKIKERDIKKFAKAVGELLELISVSLRKADVSKEDVELAEKTADTIIKLSTAMKSLAKMTLVAPLAMVGLVVMIPVWTMFSAVLALIGSFDKPIKKGLDTLEGVDKLMKNVLKTTLLILAVAGGVLLLGHFMKQHKGIMLKGLLGVSMVFLAVGAIALLGGLIGGLIKSTKLFNAEIILFTLGLMAIAGLAVGLGYFLMYKNNIKYAFAGLIGTAVMLGLMLGVAVATMAVGTIASESILAMAGVLLLIGCSMLIGALSVALGYLIVEHMNYAKAGFVGVISILGMTLGVARFAKNIGPGVRSAILDILICEGVILAAEAIVWATIKLGKLIWEFFSQDTAVALGQLAGVGMFVTAILWSTAGVSKIANRAAIDIKKGAVSLLLAEGVILASTLVVAAVIKVAKLMDEVDSKQIKLTLAIMAGIVSSAAGVAALASRFNSTIKKGALAMAAIEILMFGMTLVVRALIKTAKAGNEIGWEGVGKTVAYMAALTGEFALFIGGMGLLLSNPITATVFAVGAASLIAITSLVTLTTKTVERVLELNKVLNDSKKTPEELGKFLKETTNIFSYNNLNLEISKENIRNIRSQYKSLKPVFSTIESMIRVVSTMATQFSGMVEIGGKEGKTYYGIKPYLGMNGNVPIYGEPVYIPEVAEQIVTSVSSFVKELSTGFNNINFIQRDKIRKLSETLGFIIEPVSKFVQALISFTNNKDELLPVYLVDGEVKTGKPVNLTTIASTIGGAISSFVKGLYGDDTSTPKWMKSMGKEKNASRIKNAMGVLAEVITPIDAFVNVLASYQTDSSNRIRKIAFDDKGNLIQTEFVDINKISELLSLSIGTFANNIFGKNALWMRNFQYPDKKGDTYGSRAMHSLAEILTPVASFVEVISSLEPDGNTLYAVSIDDKGVIHKRPVEMERTANDIAKAISKFVDTLFNDENKASWQNMISTVNNNGTLIPSENSTNNTMGAFSLIIDPISNFANAISTLGGTKDENGSLLIPVFNNEGVQTNTRSIDLEFTAESIAKSVTKFLEVLFDKKNINSWLGLVYGYDLNGNVGSAPNDSMEKSIGVFAKIIDPVVRFMDTITKFEGTADNFTIFDGEKTRTINLTDVSSAISKAITTFVDGIKTSFTSIQEFVSGEEGTSSDQKDIIVMFAQSMGSILENFAKIGETKKEQIELSQTVFETYFETITKITEKVKGDIAKKEDLDKIDDVMKRGITMLTVFKDIKFEELNYKKGFSAILDVFEHCKTISEYVSKIPNNFSLDIILNFTEAGKVLNNFISEFNSKQKEYTVEVAQTYSDSITIIVTAMSGLKITDTDPNTMVIRFVSAGNTLNNLFVKYFKNFTDKPASSLTSIAKFYTDTLSSVNETFINLSKVDDKGEILLLGRFVSAGNTLNNLFVNYFKTLGKTNIDIENVTSKYLKSIQEIATLYFDIPTIDTKEQSKLWFVDPYTSAAIKINSMISREINFAENASATIDIITEIGSSMLLLSEVPSTELDKLSDSYNNLLERVIKLSNNKNTKSVSNMNNALKEATTQMTKFDERIIDKADERKKRMEELIESVAALNEKLEKTTESMKSISEHLGNIDNYNENNIKNINPFRNRNISQDKPTVNNKNEETFDNKNNTPTPPISSDVIKRGVIDALSDMKITSGIIDINSGELDSFGMSTKISGVEFTIETK